jgi:uncharacterized protein YegP (UPF0339 family)
MVFALYKDTRQEWRWTLAADNSEVLAVSSEGYKNRTDCVHAINLIKKGASTTSIYDTSKTPPALVT